MAPRHLHRSVEVVGGAARHGAMRCRVGLPLHRFNRRVQQCCPPTAFALELHRPVCATGAPKTTGHTGTPRRAVKRTSSPTSMSRRMIIQMCSTYTVPCDAVRAAPIGARCTALRCVGTAQRDCKCEAQSCHIWLRVTYNHPLSLPPPTRPPQTPWPPGRGPSSLVPKHTTVQQVAHHPKPKPTDTLGRARPPLTDANAFAPPS
jgi:hypothetical protein